MIYTNPYFNMARIAVNASLVYGVAYLGRAYFQINPVHAALFCVGSCVAHLLGLRALSKLRSEDAAGKKTFTFVGRAANSLISLTPAAVAFASGVFSPLQTITALGLSYLASNLNFLI